MKKNDLKDWMVVVYRNGSERIVDLQDGILRGLTRHASLDGFEENLLHEGVGLYDELDIVKVYAPSSGVILKTSNSDTVLHKGRLLWSRNKNESEIKSIREEMDVLSSRLKELENE